MSVMEPERIPTAALLNRIAAELLHCQTILSRIEHSVHAALDQPTAQAASLSWRKNLQDIDLLEQNLVDLAMCLASVAVEPPVHDAPDLSEARVLGRLRLDDLRLRLRGRDDIVEPADKVELF